jgi:hypothetical protein
LDSSGFHGGHLRLDAVVVVVGQLGLLRELLGLVGIGGQVADGIEDAFEVHPQSFVWL